MARVALICGASTRRLVRGHPPGLEIEAFERLPRRLDVGLFDAALVDVGTPTRRRLVGPLREAFGPKPVGLLLVRPNAALLAAADGLVGDFRLETWGSVPPESILAHIAACRENRARRRKSGRPRVSVRCPAGSPSSWTS